MLHKLSENKCYGGRQLRYQHRSEVQSCDMQFSVFLPSAAERHPVPVLYWLSGLTCNDQNFVTKAGAQQFAEQQGIAIVAPDTSPRGEDVPDDPDGEWDFGLGAGFYVNATRAPFATHYRMYDYVADELPQLIGRHFPVLGDQAAISGHSMGGHGALTIALQNPGRYRSVSAFAPICAPMQCPWGQKAFRGYLGDDYNTWRRYDSVELLEQCESSPPILIDQGGADEFLERELKPELLWQVAADRNLANFEFRMQAGYDHSYFFIASFMGDHLNFHARYLSA